MLRERVKRIATRAFFAFDRVGIHVLPKHYYSSIPDHAALRRRTAWRRAVRIRGVHWDLDRQLAWLAEQTHDYGHEVHGLEAFNRIAAEGLGPGFGAIESQVLHCVVRRSRPRRIVEVGSGMTTAIMADAAALNERDGAPPVELVSVDPFPSAALLARGADIRRELGDEVGDEIFAALRPGDLLFIDSTHTVRTGSEVLRLFLEVVPELPERVLVHVHDVTLPYLYGRDFGRSIFDWQETSVVLALLIGNTHLQVRCCQSALHYARPDELRRVLPDYRPEANANGIAAPGGGPHFPSSLWLETAD